MTFSIIIPAYNEEKYIGRCLKSVAALKIPADSSLEVIVVNNASTDKTAEVAKAVLPEAKIVEEPKKGLTRAYNRGAREAQGEILAFVDADMVLPANHLERITREFKKDPKLVALSGPYLWNDGGWWYEFVTRCIFLFLAMPAEIFFNRLLGIGADIASGNSAVKKEAFDEIGGFNENIFYGLETEFSLRIRKLGKVRFRYFFQTESSTRRFKKEGLFRLLWRYILNIVWPVIFERPFTRDHLDIR